MLTRLTILSYLNICLPQKKREETVTHRVRGAYQHSLEEIRSLNKPKVSALVQIQTISIDSQFNWIVMSSFIINRKREILNHFLRSENAFITCRHMTTLSIILFFCLFL